VWFDSFCIVGGDVALLEDGRRRTMRRSRIKADGGGYYHCMSRIIERRFILGDTEKDKFCRTMRQVEGFSGVEILTHTVLSNHFHILLKVPERSDVSDRELIRRLAYLYDAREVEQIADVLARHRKEGLHEQAELLKARYTYRMYDVSEFFKTLKQRYSQWYNRRNDRHGTLWEQRFKSIFVEGSANALLTIAAYIDLNAVRAGIVLDPKDYRYCGYGAAMGGVKEAREGIHRVLQTVGMEASWARVQCLYRKHLYVQGKKKTSESQTRSPAKGFDAEQVKEVLVAGGELPLSCLLRCRIRYFSDGLVLGSQMFVEDIFDQYRDQFGLKRKTGARPMKHGHWNGLCTMRNLRLNPVSIQ
jgi:REP element-mobilizing transposase RayT